MSFYISIKVQDRLKKEKLTLGTHLSEKPTASLLAEMRSDAKREFRTATHRNADTVDISVTPNEPNV